MGFSKSKLRRRLAKYRSIVWNDYGINMSETPSKCHRIYQMHKFMLTAFLLAIYNFEYLSFSSTFCHPPMMPAADKLVKCLELFQNLCSKMLKKKISIQNDTHESLKCTVLMLYNAGMDNNIDKETIFETFTKFGAIENIVMIPAKPYCFIEFKDTKNAESALIGTNDKELWPALNCHIYVAFVEKIPDSLNVTINFNEKPPGLLILEDFVTEDEEKTLLTCIEAYSKEETKSTELKNRRVTHFGYEFKYDNNNVDLSQPIRKIPKGLDFVFHKFTELAPKLEMMKDFIPDQLTVNNYKPGQGIPSHVDTHSAFEDPIISLSLQSSVVMEFKNVRGKCCNVYLPARSLCIMSGESRLGWTHRIATRKSDVVPSPNNGITLQFREERTSFTFRKIKQKECYCQYPELCDTQLGREKSKKLPAEECYMLHDDIAVKLEDNYVHGVYEKISDHFSETRHKPWPKVVKFIESLPVGTILVDVGCGNGKYFRPGSDHFQVGLDATMGLIRVCRQRGIECFTSNCLRIPLRDNVVDGCISIAVIHHLVTEERRKRAINEIIRVLRPKGRALIYVWAKNQEKWDKKSSYLRQRTKKERSGGVAAVQERRRVVLDDVNANLSLPVHTNRTNFVHSDLLVPWTLKEKTSTDNPSSDEPPVYLRYYHVFEDEELKTMCSALNTIDVLDYYYDQGNWCVIFEKRSLE